MRRRKLREMSFTFVNDAATLLVVMAGDGTVSVATRERSSDEWPPLRKLRDPLGDDTVRTWMVQNGPVEAVMRASASDEWGPKETLLQVVPS